MSCDSSDDAEATIGGAHFKMKSNMMYKFFNEPVDALDLRLTKAEASLSSLPTDPLFGQVKEELEEPKEHDGPLDYSEVQIFSPCGNSEERVTSTKNEHDTDYEPEFARESPTFAGQEEQTEVEDTQLTAIQRVILKANSLKSFRNHERIHPYHRISPIPWRSLLPPTNQRQSPDKASPDPPDSGHYHQQSAIHLSPNIVKHTSHPYSSKYNQSNLSSKINFASYKSHTSEPHHPADKYSLPYQNRLSTHRDDQVWEDQQIKFRKLAKSPTYHGNSMQVNTFGSQQNWMEETQKRKERRAFMGNIPTDRDQEHHHFKTEAADQDSIDQRISLAENVYNENPLLSSCDTNPKERESPRSKYSSDQRPHNETRPPQLHSLYSNNCFQVPPSQQYLARSQELLNESGHNRRQDDSSWMSAENCYGQDRGSPLNPHKSQNDTFQRFSSVIVRNRLSSEHPLRYPGEHYKKFEEDFRRVKEEEDHRYKRLHPQTDIFNGEMDTKPNIRSSYDQVPEQMEADQHWLNNIQRLRTGFAYQMLEAQRQKLQENQGQSPMRLAQAYPGKLPYVPYQILNKNVSKLPYLPKEEPDLNDNVNHHVFNGMDKFLPHGSRTSNDTLALVNHMNSFLRRSDPGRPSSYTSYNHNQVTSSSAIQDKDTSSTGYDNKLEELGSKGKRGRPRKHAPKVPLPPLYVFIRNLLHNMAYNPSVVAWVDEQAGCFKVTNTTEFARTWGRMKSNRSEEMNYEKMSRAMRYHYGSERQGRKGHLAMVKEKRLFYRFGVLAINWRTSEMERIITPCSKHSLCQNDLCLWTKE